MDNLHARIRAAQIIAGEEVVMQSLRERGLLDGQPQDPRDAEIERLRAALAFYADPARYHGANQSVRNSPPDRFAPEPGFPYLWDVTRDFGGIARAALETK